MNHYRYRFTVRSRRAASQRRLSLSIEVLEDRSLLSSSAAIAPSAGAPAYDPSSILVRFRSEAEIPPISAIAAGAVLEPELPLVPGLHQVMLPADVTVPQAVAKFSADPRVLYAEPNYHVQLADTIPDDRAWGKLYGLSKIEAPKAWDVNTGGTSVVVAVIDTGLDYTHPDLYRNVWINQAEIPASRASKLSDVDNDGLITFWDLNDPVNVGDGKITDLNRNGRIDGGDILMNMKKDAAGEDIGKGGWADGVDQNSDARLDDLIGWNSSANTRMPTDGHGHGTHVTGTIGGIGNNDAGVAGVNWKTQIMPLKIFNDAGFYAGNAKVIQMFGYAIANGAQVSNNSWGGGGASQAMKDAIRAMGGAGHIFVAAAGNYHSNNDVFKFYPCGYGLPNIVAVAATNKIDGITSFSNYGAKTVHLAAPGMDIYSTLPTAGSKMGTNYGAARGTSMATPHVTGSMALLRSQHPDWTYQQVIKQILDNVDPLPALEGKTITGGRLNLAKAISNVPTPIPPPLRQLAVAQGTTVNASTAFTIHEKFEPVTNDVDLVAASMYSASDTVPSTTLRLPRLHADIDDVIAELDLRSLRHSIDIQGL